ncbi:MAG: agmatine deiminase family protein [Saprospiraceae bacterium]|nr:agmatine deiminase family protein [Saprospiraceae bacterium]
MFVRKSLLFLILHAAFTFSCGAQVTSLENTNEVKVNLRSDVNRMAAEWEPALGTLVAWPLSVPYKLVIELAGDNKLFTLVENQQSKQEAAKWYNKWGIDTSLVTFIFAPQGIDVSWVRDWGPHAVFTPKGEMKLADPKYVYATPVTNILCNDSLVFLYKDGNKIIKTTTDDNATVPLGKQIGLEVLDLPYISTGGNVMTDGLGTSFSSCILINENRFFGVDERSFFNLNKTLLGIDRYNILSNFEKRGIQHIDCFMKLLDEERILVMLPPKDHELYQIYEDIVNKELSKLTSIYGKPYKILRMNTYRYRRDELAAYSNSLILNKTIYVPLFSIAEDSLALRRWRELMPGYTVKGFEYVLKNEPAITHQIEKRYDVIGWNHGDALHCRTRAVWDPNMLFITVKTLDEEVLCNSTKHIYAGIIDYSKQGLVDNKTFLCWREKGQKEWHKINMRQVNNKNIFKAEIPCTQAGMTIEYYVSATSNSGKTETRPLTAPLGSFQCILK